MTIIKVLADHGKQFVLTQKGYDETPAHVKCEREVGKPVFPHLGYDKSVPISWLNNGWVEEVEV